MPLGEKIRRYRRFHKRYEVEWDASLEVEFQDLKGSINGQLKNFSIGGALLHLETMYIEGQHLVVSQFKPQLNLKIFCPEGVLESKIDIRWYDRVDEDNIFKAGVQFINMVKENKEVLEKVIANL
ncbi:MAG: PilZ domain-containing protein [Deltaproteobacteria bacterium]|nr:PilZ domain-containing protein [Deltaproteobacteria bacterium]MBW2051227.1 PilZ domain-containing protein [Deltaproteobacteria bacterium]MBW2141102.1 PilZ domain-containing protein [Deltaproteobacteria bacterium]MBW2322980.1 PilZ domain-containing protein [Deltaproteobacteria bacterium]